MICSKCSNAGILNHANGKEFYYCKTCKIEIMLEDPEPFEEDLQRAYRSYKKEMREASLIDFSRQCSDPNCLCRTRDPDKTYD